MSTNPNQVPDFLTPLPKTTRVVSLPSRGVPYTGGPAQAGKLTLAAMTLVEENMLNSVRTPSGEDGINAALRACIQESIDINYLLAADKFFLFLLLRAVTYGSEYTFNWACTATLKSGPRIGQMCNAPNRSTVKIPDEFRVKTLAPEDKEPYIITLPESGKEIGFRLPRVYDEKIITTYRAENDQSQVTPGGGAEVRRGAGDTLEARQLIALLTHIDGNKLDESIDRRFVMRWFLSLPSKDIAYYRSKLDYYTPGIETKVTLPCAACGYTHEMELPLTAEFFAQSLPSQMSQWSMKFDLMLHLNLGYEEIHRIPLEELHWHYERLKEHLKEEAELRKLELQIQMKASGLGSAIQPSGPKTSQGNPPAGPGPMSKRS